MHPPLRVAMVSGEYPPSVGGVADYTALLAEHLATLGVEVHIVTGLRWDLACLPRVAHQAADCHLVHLQYQPAAYALRGAITLLPLWLRLARPHVALVTTFHDLRVPYLFPRAGPLRKLAVQMLARASHAAIFSDEDDLLAAGSGPNRHAIPIGSNLTVHPLSQRERAALRRQLGVHPEDTLIGFFGLLNASKGLDTLVEAMIGLHQRDLPVWLLLVGEPLGQSDPRNRATAAELEQRIARCGLAGRVLRTGWLAPNEASRHLGACDVIALPFRDGASARRGSLLAALAHGLPIVTTLNPNGRAFLQAGQQALLVPPGDPLALAAALERLVRDPALRVRLSRGAAQVSLQFRWPAIARATIQVYLGVLQQPRVGR